MSTFNSLLAQLPVGLNKSAGIESPDEVQLEQDFGKLAYTFLKDRASGLIPYLLGFEIVDREEDGSMAVGIFGFKIGNEFYYVPVFFVNGQIKGMDLLYSKRTNMFMPLRETWINYIINKQTIRLGEGVSHNNALRSTFEQPSFDFLAQPPQSPTGVVKSGEAVKLIDAIHDGFNTWNELQQQLIESIEKDAEFQKAWGGAIARLQKEDLPFEKSADNSPIRDWLEKKGGVKGVNALMTTITTHPGYANAALSFYPSVESLFVTKFAADLAPEKEKTEKIEIVTKDVDYLDGKERKRLIRDGFTIHDKREEPEKSELYNVDYEQRFNTPDRAGLYSVLLHTGKATKAWVFMPAHFAKSKYCVVVEPEKRHYFMAEPGAFCVRGEAHTDGPNAYENAVPLSDMEIGEKYILINADGDCTMPFTVDSTMASNGKRIRIKINWKLYPTHTRSTYGHDFNRIHNRLEVASDTTNYYFQLADHTGKRITAANKHTLIIPSNWKALKLAQFNNNADYEEERLMENSFSPGTLTDVYNALTKNALHRLLVGSDDGLEYYIRMDEDFVDGKPMNYKSAMVRLVGKYGLSVDDAEELLKEAHDNFKSRRMVKFGQTVGVNMPYPPAQSIGTDTFSGAMIQGPQVNSVHGSMVGVPALRNPMQPGFNLGGEAQMDMQAVSLAEQAGAAGQKQVFDHATIGGLAKLYDSGAVIDSYVPELTKALDRLGRVLFLFYWKNEEFAERYGTEDLAEMEDMIRGVFKSFGDLVLKLRQKAISSEDMGEVAV